MTDDKLVPVSTNLVGKIMIGLLNDIADWYDVFASAQDIKQGISETLDIVKTGWYIDQGKVAVFALCQDDGDILIWVFNRDNAENIPSEVGAGMLATAQLVSNAPVITLPIINLSLIIRE